MAVAAPDHLVAPRHLVGHRLDGWLVGWLAVSVWVLAWVGGRLGLGLSGSPTSILYWAGTVVAAGHFGLSYHLAYGAGIRDAVRRHPFALAIGPLLIATGLMVAVGWSLSGGPAAASRLTGGFITSVYLVTTWHYVKQVYGVARVGAAFAGIRLAPWEANVLRYGLYPAWWQVASAMLERGAHYALLGYPIGFRVLPLSVGPVLHWLAVGSLLPIVAAITTASRRARRRPSAVLVAPYVAALFWLILPTSPVVLALLLAPLHAIQYLAVGHRAEVAMATGRQVKTSVGWWLSIFGGAVAGGLLVSRWLPQLLDAHYSATPGPFLFAATMFVFLNLHHYLIDAVIWRSSGDLVTAVVKGRQTVVLVSEQVPVALQAIAA